MISLLIPFIVSLIIFLFPIFVQTIKNIITFFLIICSVAALLGSCGSLEFYALFVVLVYLGAIVVSTLFVILTFDIREEYRRRDTIEEWANMTIAQSIVLLLAIYTLPEIFSKTVSERLGAWHVQVNVDDTTLSSAYRHVSADIDYLSATMYTQYPEFILSTGLVLTAALFAALSISR